MDEKGVCLAVYPCEQCKGSKSGIKACLSRQHNARLQGVTKKTMTSRFRQCIKPFQDLTIYKLVDHETGQESVEFAPSMVFQVPCKACQNLKNCISAGHKLVDWTVPKTSGGQKRKISSASSDDEESPESRSSSLIASHTNGTFRSPVATPLVAQERRGKRRASEVEMERLHREGEQALSANMNGSIAVDALPANWKEDGSSIEWLDRIAEAKSKLREHFEGKMKDLDGMEAINRAKVKEAEAMFARIASQRKAWQKEVSKQRNKLDENLRVVTRARLEEVSIEEAKLKKEKEDLQRITDGGAISEEEGDWMVYTSKVSGEGGDFASDSDTASETVRGVNKQVSDEKTDIAPPRNESGVGKGGDDVRSTNGDEGRGPDGEGGGVQSTGGGHVEGNGVANGKVPSEIEADCVAGADTAVGKEDGQSEAVGAMGSVCDALPVRRESEVPEVEPEFELGKTNHCDGGAQGGAIAEDGSPQDWTPEGEEVKTEEASARGEAGTVEVATEEVTADKIVHCPEEVGGGKLVPAPGDKSLEATGSAVAQGNAVGAMCEGALDKSSVDVNPQVQDQDDGTAPFSTTQLSTIADGAKISEDGNGHVASCEDRGPGRIGSPRVRRSTFRSEF